ncbi:MAG: amidohydrolase family protein [Candidatus Sumerlaeia bacterium]|nr:amidohydrolase family protein [Candidatus Sumerlaeia bacterium]
MPSRAALLLSLIPALGAAETTVLTDTFEPGAPGLAWTSQPAGNFATVDAADEPRLSGVTLPASGERVGRLGQDGSAAGVISALTGPAHRDMAVQAWVFCEGSGGTVRGGYQGILARASFTGGQRFVRLAWDPDQAEPGQAGDGWVKLQAFNGSTWDYLGIDPADHGASTPGYIVDGTSWPSGWHLFRLEVAGDQVSAFVDDMGSPVATGTLTNPLPDGQAGLYVYSAGDWAGLYDDFSAASEAPAPAGFDVIIRGGTVYPGGEDPPVAADVGIVGDRIASVEDLAGHTATLEIDATGLIVVPGFIDTHSHADSGGALTQYLRQGVTTIIAGNCGGSPNPSTLESLFAAMAGNLGPNYMTLIGHNTLRSLAGLSGATPAPAQMQAMLTHLEQGMVSGAFGLSTGLIYATGFNSSTEEIIALASAVAPHGGIYASHIRGEGTGVLGAVAEAIEVARESGCWTQISHVKCAAPQVWNSAGDYLALVDAANAQGLHVWMDQYPYTASQTTVNVLFPQWAQSSWSDAVTNHREELEAETRELIANRGGADRVYFISGPFNRQYLSDVAAAAGKDPEDILIDDVGLGGASCVFHSMIEADVRTFMQHPLVMVGSDGPTSGHPRGSGTFPRFWGLYGRELGLFTVEEMVRKTSTLAATQFHLTEQRRGLLRTGFFADIAVVDPATVIDRATFDQPTLTPLGIPWVLVNGRAVVANGAVQSARPGRPLRLTDSFGDGSGVMLR